MNEKIKLFENSQFIYLGKTFKVMNCKVQDHKAMIFTDRQTFVKYETELDEFITQVQFVEKTSNVAAVVDEEKEASRNEVIEEMKAKGEVIPANVYHAEIMNANQRSMRISEKLEDVFNEFSAGDADEKLLKKAAAMVQLSNAIVNTEMMKFKYLNLK